MERQYVRRNERMNEIVWMNEEPLESPQSFADFEEMFRCQLPHDLRELVSRHNYASPDKGLFEIGDKEVSFDSLLSFNRSDDFNVFRCAEALSDGKELEAIPFAESAFGNLICMKDDRVVFWEHEEGDYIPVADSLSDFLELLHE